jgi:hypothetical protein
MNGQSLLGLFARPSAFISNLANERLDPDLAGRPSHILIFCRRSFSTTSS